MFKYGAPATSENFNKAFASKQIDNTFLGVLNLASELEQSGPGIDNVQKEINLLKENKVSNDGTLQSYDERLDLIESHHPIVTTIDPTVHDDIAAGYGTGTAWLNTINKKFFILKDNTAGAAVWSLVVDSSLELVTKSGTEAISNKTITASKVSPGSASALSKIVVSKATTAELLALPRESGSIYYSTDDNKFFGDNGTVLKEVGSGAGSGSGVVVSVTAGRNIVEADGVILANNNIAPIILTLPSAIDFPNKVFGVKSIGSKEVTINTSLSQTIDGQSSVTISDQYTMLSFVSNGTNWFII